MIRVMILFLAFSIWVGCSRKYHSFFQITGGSGGDFGYSVEQTLDGGFISTGYTTSFGPGTRDILVSKFYSNGSVEYVKTIGGTGWDEGSSIKQTHDGGYIITGYSASFLAEDRDLFVAKLWSNGSLDWMKFLDETSSRDEGTSVQETPDKGFVVTGFSESIGSGSRDLILCKFFSNGSSEWVKTLGGGGTGSDAAASVIITNDEGFIVTGNTESFGAKSSDILLAKFHSNGSVEWVRTLGGSKWDEGKEVQQTFDGGYIITGSTESFGDGFDVLLAKFFSDGTVEWMKTIGWSKNDHGTSVKQTLDGGYIVTGYTFSFGSSDYSDVLLSKFNSNGNVEWVKILGGNVWDKGCYVQQTNDQGYVITGYSESFGEGSDLFLLYLNSSFLENYGDSCFWKDVIPFSSEDIPIESEIWDINTMSHSNPSVDVYPEEIDYSEVSNTFICKDYVCNGIPSFNPSVCSGHGNCLYDNYCSCEDGYSSEDCEDTRGCFGIFFNENEACGIHGECFQNDSCHCESQYYLYGPDYKIDSLFECRRCPDGTYYYPNGQEPEGVVTKNISNCIACREGFASNYRTNGCEECPIGTFAADNRTFCIDCPIGYYGISPGIQGFSQFSCFPCPTGYTSKLQGLRSKSECFKSVGRGIESFLQVTGGSNYDYGYFVQQTSDFGFILTGYTKSFGAGNADAFLAKFHFDGSIEWFKSFGGSDMDFSRCVQQTFDGGYVITGYTHSYGSGDYDVLLAKFYSNGTVEWAKTLGGIKNDRGFSFQQVLDGGFVVGGITESFGVGSSDILLAKFFPNGSVEWVTTFGGTNYDFLPSIQQTFDGGYVGTGFTESFGCGTNPHNLFLSKLYSNGSVEWVKVLGGEGMDEGTSVQQTYDGSYIVTGFTESFVGFGQSARALLLCKFFTNGSVQWVKILDGHDTDGGISVWQTFDGSYLVGGYTYSFGNGNSDILLSKFYSNGSVEWVKVQGDFGVYYDRGRSVQQMFDGGYVVAGYTYTYGAGKSDAFLSFVNEHGDSCYWSSCQMNEVSIEVSDNVGNLTFLIEDWDVASVYHVIDSKSIEPYIINEDVTQNVDVQFMCFKYDECFGVLSNETEVCAAHGTCVDTDECVCEIGYNHSRNCDYTCFGVDSFADNVCNFVGDCIGLDSCNCSKGYCGEKCEIFTCAEISSKLVFEVCNGHGSCDGPDECSCVSGYYGSSSGFCDVFYCFGLHKDSLEACSSNGNCVGYDDCFCLNDYEGSYCNTFSCGYDRNDPKTCSGNGRCLQPGVCECKTFYEGERCEKNTAFEKVVAPIILVVSASGIFIFVVIVFVVCCCCCGLICLICSSFLFLLGGLGVFFSSQLFRWRKYYKLKNVDILLREQEAEDSEDIAHIRIDKKFFEIPFEEVNVIRMLGEGGSGSCVFLAKWKNRKVAFKCFKTRLVCSSQHNFNEFEKEVKVFSSISHPNIVSFFGCSMKPPRVGIVMEFCENGDLDQFLKKFQENYEMKYPLPEKVRMIFEISSALEYIHSRNVIHRDLKLENILVDDVFHCKLMDFGLSKIVEETSSGVAKTKRIGTSIYMAPELVLSTSSYDQKCDVFSFGILVWVLITEKRNPYNNEAQIESKVANNPDLRPSLDYLRNCLVDCETKVNKNVIDAIVNISSESWKHEPKDRHSFTKISKIIEEKILEPLKNQAFNHLEDLQSKKILDHNEGKIKKSGGLKNSPFPSKTKKSMTPLEYMRKRIEELEHENRSVKGELFRCQKIIEHMRSAEKQFKKNKNQDNLNLGVAFSEPSKSRKETKKRIHKSLQGKMEPLRKPLLGDFF